MAGPKLQRRRAVLFRQWPHLESRQAREPALQVRQVDGAFPWRHRRRDDELAPRIERLVTEIEQRPLPTLITDDRMDIVEADQLATRQPLEDIGPGRRQHRQWYIDRAIARAIADRLQQMSLARRPGAPHPAALARTAIGEFGERCHQRFVPRSEKTAEYGVVGKTQRQGELAHDWDVPR